MTGKDAGLVLCTECHAIYQHIPDVDSQCTCCGAQLHQRKHNSLNRTWALLIASMILYIPANVLTIMNVIYFGKDDPSTIMGGVILLIQLGSYSVAFVVFVASVVVPIFKMLGILMILLSLKYRFNMTDRQRIRLFRFIEFIGRWSMLDIFVISILAALVNISGVAVITAGQAATAFGTVVVLTMLAANSFDTRLLWDCKTQD
ncbi:paraquat-inducible protein A [sulfur-oxidizing endosymbiont of Gigantopelta aegis]|uniref:paraquat-inducible protein A n=1 Tax=sulfur-oxidizing endosymbiont of Gigantopelta aegis TaxID=2794934 RepID=UPI0018DCC5E5|nr:paraquat-inducible protein A [sulfur-oxidizing endosymbiont of Gigantopelta aegis]